MNNVLINKIVLQILVSIMQTRMNYNLVEVKSLYFILVTFKIKSIFLSTTPISGYYIFSGKLYEQNRVRKKRWIKIL